MTKLAEPYEAGYGYIIMHIPAIDGLPDSVTLSGRTYRSVTKLHCTLISTAKLSALLQDNKQLSREDADAQAEAAVASAVNRIRPTFQSYLNEVRLADRDASGKHTLVVMARVKGLRELFDDVNRQLGTDLPLQPAHVTVFHGGKNYPFGIPLNSQADIQELTRPLTEATRDELTRQMDPYKTFSWSLYMSPAPVRNNLILEFHVPSFAPERDFYAQFGFQEIHYDPISGGGVSDLGYFELKREDSLGRTQLNFYGDKDSVANHARFNEFPPDTPRGYGVEVTIPVDDVEDLWERVGRHLPKNDISQPLEIKRWGKRDFRVVDPFGFYIRFTEPVDWMQNR